jgi:predicted RNA-binding Zn-ribbon protein involved in translation (DUF1610 family)
MTAEERIRTLAEDFAAQSQSRARQLHAELLEAQQRVLDIKANLDAANLSFKRLANFNVGSNGDYFCPRCGIMKGIRVTMTCRPGRPRLDLFECNSCGFEMDVAH